MRYSKGLILYRDDPDTGLALRLISTLVPDSLLILSYVLFSSGERQGGIVLLAETIIFSLILLAVYPRSYEVYEDHVQIALGPPFNFKVRVWFDNIKSIEVTSRLIFSVNFATRMTGKYVSIIPKNGMAIAITPKDSEAFVESANQALGEWLKSRQDSSRLVQ